MTGVGEEAGRDVQLFVVGAGVQVPDHLTVAALDALHRCKEIYSILPPSSVDSLPNELAAKVSDLGKIYVQGSRRADVYREEVDAIWRGVLANPPVAYLTTGNPVVFDTVTAQLIGRASQCDVGLRLIAGISSVDAIMADLGFDYAPGLQVFDASALVAYKIAPRTDLTCLLLQPDAFGTAFVAMGRRPRASAMAPLREHLLRHYPASHVVTYVTCPTSPTSQVRVESFPLCELGGTKDSPQAPGASLLIPLVNDPKLDKEFCSRMTNGREFELNFE